MADKPDNVVSIDGSTIVDFEDHQYFLDEVKAGILDRDVLNTIVLVFDKEGHLTLHTSCADTERVQCLLARAWQHSIDMWSRAIDEGHLRHKTPQTGESDENGGDEPA